MAPVSSPGDRRTTVPAPAVPSATAGSSPAFRIAAVGLTSSRGVAWDDDGNVFVAFGGMGGNRLSGPDRHIEAPLGPYRGGPIGQTYRVAPSGEISVFVEGLPSSRDQFRGKQGVSDEI